jgi:hypothetical protein
MCTPLAFKIWVQIPSGHCWQLQGKILVSSSIQSFLRLFLQGKVGFRFRLYLNRNQRYMQFILGKDLETKLCTEKGWCSLFVAIVSWYKELFFKPIHWTFAWNKWLHIVQYTIWLITDNNGLWIGRGSSWS